ncbi:hypothetical protein [Megasphaera cerevisiae]|uniref:hypothetical protein n=1 Tax=Megasphaera cerevisiae TaxID=39029 RepID=UPI0009440F10|nr:hypothetical protein [Megasphaera cerevisiae]OKY53401.1 hypothetical protein BSR42_07560 [Megasphaera cerevisiae]
MKPVRNSWWQGMVVATMGNMGNVTQQYTGGGGFFNFKYGFPPFGGPGVFKKKKGIFFPVLIKILIRGLEKTPPKKRMGKHSSKRPGFPIFV